MTFLLDVNVLIALIDPGHVQHDTAHEWFSAKGKQAWATCPLTQNGVLRIVGQASGERVRSCLCRRLPLIDLTLKVADCDLKARGFKRSRSSQ